MSDRYAVVGNPVGHSKSPLIHAAFARQTGQDIAYDRLLAPLDAFAVTAKRFFHEGGHGLNVTVPFKREAWDLVDECEGAALSAEAVNTIKRVGNQLIGYNTDGKGLLADLEHNLGATITGKRVLLMGAGGASYGVLQPLLERKPDLLIVANRTLDKAERLVRHFHQHTAAVPQGVMARPYENLGGQPFDLVVNATSAGLEGVMPPLPENLFAPGAIAYDMVYGIETRFLAFARSRGVRCADGLGMLVEQAAESFFIWRGVRPDTAPVIAQLRCDH
ncbi:MAG: shikimate dehydrogenase [Burkholderiales bacterium]|jgi:shikimate dehydrogenase